MRWKITIPKLKDMSDSVIVEYLDNAETWTESYPIPININDFVIEIADCYEHLYNSMGKKTFNIMVDYNKLKEKRTMQLVPFKLGEDNGL